MNQKERSLHRYSRQKRRFLFSMQSPLKHGIFEHFCVIRGKRNRNIFEQLLSNRVVFAHIHAHPIMLGTYILASMESKGLHEIKTAIIVTGPECSGSTFIAQIVAHTFRLGGLFQEWSGRGQLGDSVVVLHRSQPHGDGHYLTLEQFEDLFPGYILKFIVCTRDRTVMGMSNLARRNKDAHQHHIEIERAISIMKDVIASRHPVFLWSYETFMLLQNVYLDTLLPFLGEGASKFSLSEELFKDGNLKFIVKINK